MKLKTNITCLKDLEYFEETQKLLYVIEREEEPDELVFDVIHGLNDPLEHLPKFVSFRKALYDPWRDYYHYYKIKPYLLAKRIIEKNIGKSYDLAYSYYLKKFPPNYDRTDIEYAWNYKFEHRRRSYNYYPSDYFIDENKLIQKNKTNRKTQPIVFYSDDYKTQLIHKITKHPITKFIEVWSYNEEKYDRYNSVLNKYYPHTYQTKYELLYLNYKNKYKAQLNDFEEIIIAGQKFEFTSKNDYKYRKLFKEKQQKSNIQIKRKEKEKQLFDYNSLIKEGTIKYFKNLEEKQIIEENIEVKENTINKINVY